MATVTERTLAAVVAEVARLGGWWRNAGTATAGTTTTLTDATNERTPVTEANSVKGTFLYFTGGTGAGDEHEIHESGYSTIGVMGWATAGTAPTTSTTYVRMAIRPQLILDAIAEVTRESWRKQAKPYTTEAIVTNNLLMHYGAMEEWAAGASSAPDGFTLGGAGAAVARESTIIAQGLYSAKVTAGAGAVGTLTRTLPRELVSRCKGETLFLLGLIAENVVGDITVRVDVTKTDGTAATGSPHDREGTLTGDRWQELEDINATGISIPDPVGSIAVSTRSALSAVTYADDLVLYGPPIYDYDLPATLIGLQTTIWMETDYRSGKFTIPLRYGDDWKIIKKDGSAARLLHFHRPLPSARHLRIEGYRAPDVITAATSNVEPKPTWLAHAAAVRLVGQVGAGSDHVDVDALKAKLESLEGSTEGNVLKNTIVIFIEDF